MGVGRRRLYGRTVGVSYARYDLPDQEQGSLLLLNPPEKTQSLRRFGMSAPAFHTSPGHHLTGMKDQRYS